MGFGVGLDIFRAPEVGRLEENSEIREKYKANNAKKGREIPESHLARFPGAFWEFRRIDGLTSRVDTDLSAGGFESVAWSKAFQRPKRQAGEIPTSAMAGWGGLIMYKNLYVQGGLFARPFSAEVSSGLR